MKTTILGIIIGIMIVAISVLSYQVYKISEKISDYEIVKQVLAKHETTLFDQTNGIIPFLNKIISQNQATSTK